MIDYITPENLDEKTDQWLRAIGPFNLHDWSPDPERSALLVIDCQNYFVAHPEPEGVPILPRIRMLIDAFHAAGRPIFFTQHMHKADGSDLGILGEWWEENIVEGTPESELHHSLGVAPDDFLIRKNRYNAFLGTDLDDLLRREGVRDIVITGVMTNLCCETTARHAFCRDYRVFLPADANGTASEEMHIASLINLGFGFATILKTSDVLESFGQIEKV